MHSRASFQQGGLRRSFDACVGAIRAHVHAQSSGSAPAPAFVYWLKLLEAVLSWNFRDERELESGGGGSLSVSQMTFVETTRLQPGAAWREVLTDPELSELLVAVAVRHGEDESAARRPLLLLCRLEGDVFESREHRAAFFNGALAQALGWCDTLCASLASAPTTHGAGAALRDGAQAVGSLLASLSMYQNALSDTWPSEQLAELCTRLEALSDAALPCPDVDEAGTLDVWEAAARLDEWQREAAASVLRLWAEFVPSEDFEPERGVVLGAQPGAQPSMADPALRQCIGRALGLYLEHLAHATHAERGTAPAHEDSDAAVHYAAEQLVGVAEVPEAHELLAEGSGTAGQGAGAEALQHAARLVRYVAADCVPLLKGALDEAASVRKSHAHASSLASISCGWLREQSRHPWVIPALGNSLAFAPAAANRLLLSALATAMQ